MQYSPQKSQYVLCLYYRMRLETLVSSCISRADFERQNCWRMSVQSFLWLTASTPMKWVN